jgi:hypothetical protein
MRNATSWRAFKLSVAGYIVKPVDYRKFVDAIRTIDLYWTLSELPEHEAEAAPQVAEVAADLLGRLTRAGMTGSGREPVSATGSVASAGSVPVCRLSRSLRLLIFYFNTRPGLSSPLPCIDSGLGPAIIRRVFYRLSLERVVSVHG